MQGNHRLGRTGSLREVMNLAFFGSKQGERLLSVGFSSVTVVKYSVRKSIV